MVNWKNVCAPKATGMSISRQTGGVILFLEDDRGESVFLRFGDIHKVADFAIEVAETVVSGLNGAIEDPETPGGRVLAAPDMEKTREI